MPKVDAGQRREGATGPHPVHVLPRPLRLAWRHGIKLMDGTATVPTHLGSAFSVGFLAAAVAYGALIGGHLDTAMSTTASRLGLSVDAIKIVGHTRTTEQQVIDALALDGNASIMTLDVQAARERIMAWPWIESVDIAKAYPDSIRVELREKTARAIWQNGSEVLALDGNGSVIGSATLAADRRLPAFVGKGADRVGLAFADHVAQLAPSVSSDIRAHVLVAGRRWDLVLENDVVVKLPETGVDAALVTLESLEGTHGVLARDITAIDLRVEGKVVLGLGEVAREALAERLEADGKAKS